MNNEKKICKKCLMRDLEKAERQKLKSYLAVIKEPDRAEDVLYQKRLEVCLGCDYLTDATCNACGCYVEFRAAVKHGKCPYKKW